MSLPTPMSSLMARRESVSPCPQGCRRQEHLYSLTPQPLKLLYAHFGLFCTLDRRSKAGCDAPKLVIVDSLLEDEKLAENKACCWR